MIDRFIRFTVLFLAPLLVACGGGKGFKIEFEVDGLGNKGVEMVVSDGRTVSRSQIHPKNGRFTASGEADRPMLAEFFTLDGSRIFSAVVGEDVRMKVSFAIDSLYTTLQVSGSPDMELYASWLTDNSLYFESDETDEVNALIASLVASHRESAASALIMVTEFRSAGHALQADSVFNLIAPQARSAGLTAAFSAAVGRQTLPESLRPLLRMSLPVGRDSNYIYIPQQQSYSLIAFSDVRKPDSVVRRLRGLARGFPLRRLRVLEISCAIDSSDWRSAVMADSVCWHQAWVVGGVASSRLSRMALPRVPFYIVADSLGTQLYRGESLFTADTLLRSLLGAETQVAAEVHSTEADSAEVPKEQPLAPGQVRIRPARP
ncbi:MAG: DUF4369 domain-containing protein [Duncaniella sp.]|nr:DUF4369 domain-containing protein [Duncaniella sp.]